jgi:hypothetical protein
LMRARVEQIGGDREIETASCPASPTLCDPEGR